MNSLRAHATSVTAAHCTRARAPHTSHTRLTSSAAALRRSGTQNH